MNKYPQWFVFTMLLLAGQAMAGEVISSPDTVDPESHAPPRTTLIHESVKISPEHERPLMERFGGFHWPFANLLAWLRGPEETEIRAFGPRKEVRVLATYDGMASRAADGGVGVGQVSGLPKGLPMKGRMEKPITPPVTRPGSALSGGMKKPRKPLELVLKTDAGKITPLASGAGSERNGSMRDEAERSGFEAALHATLTQHPALRGKQAEVNAKRFDWDSARAERYPTLSTQFGLMDSNAQEAVLRARQPVWAFGRIDSAIAYADADVVAEEADLLNVKRRLIEETAVAYAGVLGVRDRREIAVKDIKDHKELFEQIERRAKGRLASRTDMRLAAARLVQSRARKARVDGEFDVALAELRALTRVPVAADGLVAPRFTRLPETDQLEAMAVGQSAGVQYKKMLVELARADVKKQRTLSMPTVYLQATHSYDSNANALYDEDTQLGIVIEGNMEGIGLVSRGRRHAASARLEAAGEDLQTTRNELVRHVRTLIANRRMQRELIRVHGNSVEELEATLGSYKRQYEAGHKAWLDVLNIQRELTEQRMQRALAGNEWLIHSLRIAALIGLLDNPYGSLH